MDPVTATLGAVSIGSAIFGAVGSVQKGNAEAQQQANAAMLAQRQAKDVDLQALQISGARRDQLRTTLSNIAADQTQKNVNIDSPSSIAIENSIKGAAGRSEQNQRIGLLNQKQALLWGAQNSQQASSNAITAGWLGAGDNLIKGALRTYDVVK